MHVEHVRPFPHFSMTLFAFNFPYFLTQRLQHSKSISSSEHVNSAHAIKTSKLVSLTPNGKFCSLQQDLYHGLSTIITRDQSNLSTTLLILTPTLLRLYDNPIFINSTHSPTPTSSTVLPIALFEKPPNLSQLSALQDLRARLLSIGSELLLVIGSHHKNLISIVKSTRANRIVLSQCVATKTLLTSLQANGVRHQIIISDETFVNALKSPVISLSPPPPTTTTISCTTYISPFRGGGETAARIRLFQLISSKILLPVVCRILTREMRAGYITHHRIVEEVTKAQIRNPHFDPMPELRNWFTKDKFNPFIASSSETALVMSGAVTAGVSTINAYDVNEGDRRGVKWDASVKEFVLQEWEHTETERRMSPKERAQEFLRRRRLFFMRAFLPDDVTPDYYSFAAWRFAQRCASATISIFGTSSLLFALGVRSGRIGKAAIVSWILKDGFSRFGKMIWAGSMGKDFDADPKRWRFRSALLYAGGNGLEIITQIFPALFLVCATASKTMKQVSMLTSSATRNTMYRSFGDRSQNIANITAKGEAQIVVADLIGMACGICLSKVIGSSRVTILGTYSALTFLDMFGIYMELRQVVFRTLNAERSDFLIDNYISNGRILTPAEVSAKEHIFLKPSYKNRIHLTSIAKAARDPEELDLLLRIFKKERFMISTPRSSSNKQCQLVLRNDASNTDVLRAMIMIGYVHHYLSNDKMKKEYTIEKIETILRNAQKSSKRTFPGFLNNAKKAGWNTESLMFNTFKRRGYWEP